MYVIKCYAREDDKNYCLIMARKSRAAAYKRAEKAKETFPKVTVEKEAI